MFNCLDTNTAFEIFVGCVSSLIVWWLINIVLSPRLKIEKDLQYPNKKKCIRIKNWTCFDAYNVRIKTEYRINGNKLDSYISTGEIIPSIERRETYLFELALKNDYVKSFFSGPNENSRLIITIVFQSKFGVKTRKTRTILFNKERVIRDGSHNHSNQKM